VRFIPGPDANDDAGPAPANDDAAKVAAPPVAAVPAREPAAEPEAPPQKGAGAGFSFKAERIYAEARKAERARKTFTALGLYRQLVRDFPDSDRADDARTQIRALGGK
jgi:hypothetical protein